MAVSATIEKMIYNSLHITGTADSFAQSRVSDEIADGILFIRKYCDPAASCEPGTEYAEMLKSYVMYAEDGAIDQFAENYRMEIRSGRIESETDAYAEAMQY